MQRVMNLPGLSQSKQTASNIASAGFMIRVYSALVLIGIALFLTLNSVESFALLIAIFTAAMAWEWGRLVRGQGFDATSAIQLLTTSAAALASARACPSCALLAVLAGTGAVFLLKLLMDGRPQALWSASGVLYAGFPAVALIWLRSDPDYGVLVILYLFAIVWTTDSAAFLFGRWIGGAKLARRISPKKTWSGLIGGAVSAGLAGAIFGAFAGIPGFWLSLLAVILALIAQLGDLGESAIKRAFGTKDSSSLIPGHGGVLDRIDGLILAAIAAAIFAWTIDPAHPGRALLFWP